MRRLQDHSYCCVCRQVLAYGLMRIHNPAGELHHDGYRIYQRLPDAKSSLSTSSNRVARLINDIRDHGQCGVTNELSGLSLEPQGGGREDSNRSIKFHVLLFLPFGDNLVHHLRIREGRNVSKTVVLALCNFVKNPTHDLARSGLG
jgi:hypothetical protein